MTDWETGKNDGSELHHILGRVSESPYNAAPLSNKSHAPEGRKNLPAIHSYETRSKYLQRTKRYLDSINYQPTKEDEVFIEKNKKYYG